MIIYFDWDKTHQRVDDIGDYRIMYVLSVYVCIMLWNVLLLVLTLVHNAEREGITSFY